jgi:hypothetical protein
MLSVQRATDLAVDLDLDVNQVGICFACLSVVSFVVDDGDEREIRRNTFRMTPDLWEDGLALPARLTAPSGLVATLQASDRSMNPLLASAFTAPNASLRPVGVLVVKGPLQPFSPSMPEREPAPGAASRHARGPLNSTLHLAPPGSTPRGVA